MPSQGLLNDILFKIVFGVQNSEPVLLALLNALLGYSKEQKIVEITIENPTLDKEYITDKGVVLDLKAVDGRGRWYNIEVQLEPEGGREHYVKRSVCYLAKLYTDQLERGGTYGNMAKTISISLLDFVLFQDTDDLHSTFHLKEKTKGFLLTDIIELHYIELKKFSIYKPRELRTPFERWLHILKFSEIYAGPNGEPLPDNLLEEEGISMAIESLKKAYARDEVREMIKAREKARRDYLSSIEYATQKGIEQGIEQERERKGREVARRMLAMGLTEEQVRQATGLSAQEIVTLEREPLLEEK